MKAATIIHDRESLIEGIRSSTLFEVDGREFLATTVENGITELIETTVLSSWGHIPAGSHDYRYFVKALNNARNGLNTKEETPS